jgi:hypothetical protein
VSIPQRLRMGPLADGVDVEGRRGAAQLAAQRRQAARVHAFGPQEKTFPAELKFETVAGLDAQRVQNAGRKRDLPPRREVTSMTDSLLA